jgi:maltokinase
VANGEWPSDLDERIPGYLGAQRWFAGSEPHPDFVTIERATQLWPADPEAARRLWQLVVGVDGDHYQLLLGERPAGEPADFLHSHEEAVIGGHRDSYFYDATLDAEMARVLLEVASHGEQTAALARPLSADQSNTSLVYDDRLILKLFRRLHVGSNPDVEVTNKLADAGFEHVAAPLVHWHDENYDLAFGQQFLAGGSDGWKLALTSLRDLYNRDEAEAPAHAGGDFASEAERLGRVTSLMHLTLRDVFEQVTRDRAEDQWHELLHDIEDRLVELSKETGRDFDQAASPAVQRLRAISDPGPFIRVHGDYHLGQVMRTDTGWYILDFEGEPARSLAERTAPNSVLKDVTGMLRSFHYASFHAVVEQPFKDWGTLRPRARSWESHNRTAFLDGYQANAQIHSLLPDPATAAAVMYAYELDKALYEFEYERGHRPEWVSIPLDALEWLVYGVDSGE